MCLLCHCKNPFFLRLRRSGGLSQLGSVEPVSGFEPLTVRLQGGCSAKLSYTGRLVRIASDAEPLPGYRFGQQVAAARRQAAHPKPRPSQTHKSIIPNGPCPPPHRQPSPTTVNAPPSRN